MSVKYKYKKEFSYPRYVYNNILRLSYIPPNWKHSVTILIHKPGKPPDAPSSYTPITYHLSASQHSLKSLKKLSCKEFIWYQTKKKIFRTLTFALGTSIPLSINYTDKSTILPYPLKKKMLFWCLSRRFPSVWSYLTRSSDVRTSIPAYPVISQSHP